MNGTQVRIPDGRDDSVYRIYRQTGRQQRKRGINVQGVRRLRGTPARQQLHKFICLVLDSALRKDKRQLVKDAGELPTDDHGKAMQNAMKNLARSATACADLSLSQDVGKQVFGKVH